MLLGLVFNVTAQGKELPLITLKKEIRPLKNAGEYEVKITITCEKGSVTTFAMYKEMIPLDHKNVEVTEVKNAGATFKYVNNEIKFIWSSINFSGTMEISYTIKNAGDMKPDMIGSFKFAFDQEKQSVEMKPEDILLVKR